MIITIILFQVLIFVGLIFLLRHFMQGHVSGAMGHLQKLNDELLKQQSELKQKIAEAEKEYQSKMAKLQQDVTQLQAQAKQEAAKTLEEARARAQQEREKMINEAVETRDKMRHEIMAEMEEKAIGHSRDLIEAFLTGDIREFLHVYLVKEVISGIADLPTDQFQIQGDSAHLTSAQAITDDMRRQLQKALKEKIKKEVVFKEEVDPLLVGGLILRLGTFVIDGSLTNKLKESSARLKKETARMYQGKK